MNICEDNKEELKTPVKPVVGNLYKLEKNSKGIYMFFKKDNSEIFVNLSTGGWLFCKSKGTLHTIVDITDEYFLKKIK